jgi:hypothetical protein
MCPICFAKKLKIWSLCRQFSKCKQNLENFPKIFKKYAAYAPVFKMCPKNFRTNFQVWGLCPNFQNVPKRF